MTQIVHNTIDTEIVAMFRLVARGFYGFTRNNRILLVQWQLTDTVDRINGWTTWTIIICGHTVFGTLQYQTTTEHATQISTLNGVQQSACIDGAKTPRLESRLDLSLIIFGRILLE